MNIINHASMYVVYETYNNQLQAIVQTTSLTKAQKIKKECERYRPNMDYTYHIKDCRSTPIKY